MAGPRRFVLEWFRAERAEDPYGFTLEPQTYLLRHEGGVAETVRLDWDAELLRDVAGLQATEVSAELKRRLGDRLQALLSRTRWREQQAALAAGAEGEGLELTLRALAAELYVLPWELMTLDASGLPLAAHPRVLLRYEWPGSPGVPDALPGRSLGRVAFAWSEAGGAVAREEHLALLRARYGVDGFDEIADPGLASLARRLAAAREAGAPHRTLHVLCHGEARGGAVGLAWSRGLVDGPALAERLAPFADTLRLIVLGACMGGRGGPPGSHLGAIAQHLHRAGFRAVVASRTPLSIAGSLRLTEALHEVLAAGGSPEQATLAARRALHEADASGMDWASLQLYARAVDADEALSGLASLRRLGGLEHPASALDAGLSGLAGLPEVAASPVPELARRHVGLTAVAFLQALSAAQPDPATPAVAEALDALLARAGVELVRERPGADDVSESERLRALTGSPLCTPTYLALRTALRQPDAPQALRVPDEADLERRFLDAWRRLLGSEAGEAVRRHLIDLEAERQGLVGRLVLAELAGWGHRHVFGNRRMEDLPAGELPLPLDALRVAQQARMGEQVGEALELVDRALGEGARAQVALVVGPLGVGKSLMARALVARQAQRELGEAHGPRAFPVYISCGADLDPPDPGAPVDEALLDRARRRAWRRQLGPLVADLRLSATALDLPPGGGRQLWVLDDLDQWTLDPRRLDQLLRLLLDLGSESRGFLVLSRAGLALDPRLLERAATLTLEPFDDRPGGDLQRWLEQWRALGGEGAPTRLTLRQAKLLELARQPGLLVTLARLGADLPAAGGSTLALHERLLRQFALGKVDGQGHRRVASASRVLLDRLRAREDLPADAEPVEAMLWLMSRVAWELSRARQRRRGLGVAHLRAMLCEELGFAPGEEVEELLGALRLVLQVGEGVDAPSLLMGHAPFLPHLVARFWANRLKGLGPTAGHGRPDFARDLLGGRLLDDDGAAWRQLMEMISGVHHGLGPLFSWTLRDRRELASWAEAAFRDESLVTSGRFRDDQRAHLREAALAIRCGLDELPPLMLSEDALRSLLAWFWVRQEPAMVVARRCDLSGFRLKQAPMAGADLRGARLRDAELGLADLSFSNLEDADLDGARLAGAELTGARLARATLRRANLEQANLSSASLDGADLSGVEASGCELEGAQLPGAALCKADLIRANLAGANLAGADLREARLQDSHLVGADLSGADLRGADLSRADLSEAGLDEARLEGAQASSHTRWPEGFDPDAAGVSSG